MKRIPILLVALLLLAGACGDEADFPPTTEQTTTSGGATTTVTTVETTEATTTTAAPPTSGVDAGDLPPGVVGLIALTEDLRGLEFLDPVQVTVLTPEELAARVRANIAEELDPQDIGIDQAFFRLIGILPADVDLARAIEDLYAEQVGGFYDSDTGELVVAGADRLSPLAEIIVVHELTHALTDQHFGFAATMDELAEAGRYHEAAAIQALAEGDATYVQILFLQQMDPDEQIEAVMESLAVDTAVLDGLPPWFAEDLAFPYERGFGFVERLVSDGGLDRLNQAYQLLPTTVEQIMHPTAYFALEPAHPVTLSETLVEGYQVYEEDGFGEWNLFLYLLGGVADGVATVAAAGWGGDAYRILWNGPEVAFTYLFQGDTPRDAEELESALIESLAANMAVGRPVTDEEAQTAVLDGADYAFVQRSGSQVLLVAASDPAVGRALVGMLQLEPAD